MPDFLVTPGMNDGADDDDDLSLKARGKFNAGNELVESILGSCSTLLGGGGHTSNVNLSWVGLGVR